MCVYIYEFKLYLKTHLVSRESQGMYQDVCIYVCLFLYVCMYVCMYVYVRVCMYVRNGAIIFVVRVYVCVYI